MTDFRSVIAVAVGGNLPFRGSPTSTSLTEAVGCLASADVLIRSVSRFFQTPCFPEGAGPDYVNAAVLLETNLDPAELLQRLHMVEAQFDRARVQRWGGRTLDLDLLCYGQTILPDRAGQKLWLEMSPRDQASATPEQLILPHPRMQDRAFALVPLMDIAPDWVHPVLQKTVAELCAGLPKQELDAVRPL